MTRVMILGAGGMLGHKAWQVLGNQCQVYGTVRTFDARLRATGIFDEARILSGVDAWNLDSVSQAIAHCRPDWVINCIGIVKQRAIVNDAKQAIYVNALFPHLVAELCAPLNIRVIQISTDCVFSGKKGSYRETDLTDAEDQYGRTKLLGELTGPHCLTLRTSIVGRDLFSNYSLIDWFLSCPDTEVRGYARALYSGLTTAALSREIGRVISSYPHLHGLYHVSSAPVTKYDLLGMVKTAFHAPVTIVRDETFISDRSMISDRYRRETRAAPPRWEDMIQEMAADPTGYERFRQALSAV